MCVNEVLKIIIFYIFSALNTRFILFIVTPSCRESVMILRVPVDRLLFWDFLPGRA